MRLISCNVENFGRLHDESFSFENGLNTICEGNGWGKSTFASFVRAMFYGLEGDRKRSIDENERKRYKPWQGGVFGGKLVFEIDSKKYEITRIFADKENNDEFELRDYDTNLISNDYSKDIGEEIFGINSESFMRTIFIGQNSCETKASDDINAKIGNLTDNTNDLNNFENASAKLTALLNSLTPSRSTGSINKRKTEIAELERVVKDEEQLKKSFEEYHELIDNEKKRYEELQLEIKKVQDDQLNASKNKSFQDEKKEWERLKGNFANAKTDYENAKQFFKGDIPSIDEIDITEENISSYEKMRAVSDVSALNEEELLRYEKLKNRFLDNVPSLNEIDEKISKLGDYLRLSKAVNQNSMRDYEEERLDTLERMFGNDDATINSVIGKWNERNVRKNSLPSNRASLNMLKATIKKGEDNKGSLLLIILGIVLLMTGAGLLLALDNTKHSIAFGAIGLGAVCLICGIAIKLLKKSSKSLKEALLEANDLQMKIAEDLDYIDETTDEVSEYLIHHGKIFSEETASIYLQEILNESFEYNSLKKKAIYKSDKDDDEEYHRLNNELVGFLNDNHVIFEIDNISDAYYGLRADVNAYNDLKEKAKTSSVNNEKLSELKKMISLFFDKYLFEKNENPALAIKNIRKNTEHFLRASLKYNEDEKLLDEFEKKNDVSLLEEIKVTDSKADEEGTLLDLANKNNSLNSEIDNVRNKLNFYEKGIDEIAVKLDNLEENKVRLEELKEIQKVEQKRFECLSLAKEKLSLAKERLTSKYTDPILNSFGSYFELIAGMASHKFKLDANTNITVDELGKQREINSLSLGYRDLVGICLRLSLIDAMYESEEPFIIMDDPFTNLDDEKLEATKEFLGEISKKYQIIYFTCSNSRC